LRKGIQVYSESHKAILGASIVEGGREQPQRLQFAAAQGMHSLAMDGKDLANNAGNANAHSLLTSSADAPNAPLRAWDGVSSSLWPLAASVYARKVPRKALA
jgi:hypothetical protein